jgi:hypothetical protein
MKLRIIKDGNYYVPQFRDFFIWKNFSEPSINHIGKCVASKISLVEAELWIENYIKDCSINYKTTQVVKKYNIKTSKK